MARINVEELYRGEGAGAKYGSGVIMGAVTKEIAVYRRHMTSKHGLRCWLSGARWRRQNK